MVNWVASVARLPHCGDVGTQLLLLVREFGTAFCVAMEYNIKQHRGARLV